MDSLLCMDDLLYSLYEAFYVEVKELIDFYSGTIDEFDPENKIISITVAPEDEQHVSELLYKLITKYDERKQNLSSFAVFDGVISLIN